MARQQLRRAASGLSRAARGPGLGAACVLALLAAWPCAGGAAAGERSDIATPLGTVNLNPFHLPWGVPVSHGARVLGPGSTELVVSFDMASHFRGDAGGGERVLIDGETWRQSVSLRRGLGDGWEYLVGLSAVSHGAGVFDGFIEGWHDAFGLPQSGRDRAPRDRFSVLYARDGETLVDLGDEVSRGDVLLVLESEETDGEPAAKSGSPAATPIARTRGSARAGSKPSGSMRLSLTHSCADMSPVVTAPSPSAMTAW